MHSYKCLEVDPAKKILTKNLATPNSPSKVSATESRRIVRDVIGRTFDMTHHVTHVTWPRGFVTVWEDLSLGR